MPKDTNNKFEQNALLSRWAFYPFLTIAWTFLNLLAANYTEIMSVYLDDFIKVFFFVLLSSGGLWLLIRRVCSFQKASLITFILLVVVLFSGEWFFILQKGVTFFFIRFSMTNPTKFLLLETSFLLALIAFFYKSPSLLKVFHRLSNFILLIMTGLAIASVGFQVFSSHHLSANAKDQNFKNFQEGNFYQLKATENYKPDIYYIILDGYANGQVLQKYFNFDNTEFLDSMSGRGFYIAENSISNYSRTGLSLPSSLNFRYLNEIYELPKGSQRSHILRELLQENRVMRIFQQFGYKTINFSTAWGLTESLRAADINIQCGTLNEFDFLILKQSILGLFIDKINTSRRQYVFCPFERLPGLARMPGPKFFFVHIISPHRPYLFDRYGNPVKDHSNLNNTDLDFEDPQKYLEQLRFINKKVITLI